MCVCVCVCVCVCNFQYLGRVEGKNSFKLYLSCRRVYFSGAFLLRTSDIPPESARSAFLLTTVQSFCSRLFTGYSFPGAWLTWRPSLANVCPELKILFQISSNEKVLFFGSKRSGQSFGLFLPSLYFIRSCDSMTYIPFSVQPIIGFGVQVAFDLSSYLPFNSQSWDLFVQTQRGGEFIFPFPFSVAYHVTCETDKIR